MSEGGLYTVRLMGTAVQFMVRGQVQFDCPLSIVELKSPVLWTGKD
jgi:hypothetical protein